MKWTNSLCGDHSACYHRLNEELKQTDEVEGDLEQLQAAITREIAASQHELRDAVQDAMECESIRAPAKD